MPQVTVKNYLFDKAPPRIELLGDKTRRPEPADHIIEFPGGAIELSRTSDGNYWAHIIVNRDFALPDDVDGLRAAYGEIVASRIDYDFPTEPNIVDIPHAEQVRQIAILIEPRLSQRPSTPTSAPQGPSPADEFHVR
jgi:hypothetical protein